MSKIWDGLNLDPKNPLIFEQHINREKEKQSSESITTGETPEEVADEPEAQEAVDTTESSEEDSGGDEFGGGDESDESEEGTDDDEFGGDEFGGGDDEGDDSGGGLDSGEEVPLGENPLAEVYSKKKLISELQDLHGYIKEAIDLGQRKPKASVVVKKLEDLAELIRLISESALISSPADTMTRYELATRQYQNLVRQLKRIT